MAFLYRVGQHRTACDVAVQDLQRNVFSINKGSLPMLVPSLSWQKGTFLAYKWRQKGVFRTRIL